MKRITALLVALQLALLVSCSDGGKPTDVQTSADTGFITEALDFWSYKYTRPKAYDLTYKQKTARDENSAGMLDIIFDTLCIDFNYIKDFGGSYKALKKVPDGKGELASEMDSLRSKIDSDIEKYVSGWKTGTN